MYYVIPPVRNWGFIGDSELISPSLRFFFYLLINQHGMGWHFSYRYFWGEQWATGIETHCYVLMPHLFSDWSGEFVDCLSLQWLCIYYIIIYIGLSENTTNSKGWSDLFELDMIIVGCSHIPEKSYAPFAWTTPQRLVPNPVCGFILKNNHGFWGVLHSTWGCIPHSKWVIPPVMYKYIYIYIHIYMYMEYHIIYGITWVYGLWTTY